MKNGLYTIIEFTEKDKWFVIGETTYNNEVYNYLIKLTPDGSDFVKEYRVVKCQINNGKENFITINDREILKQIMPSLIPNLDELLKNPKESLKELMKY